MPTPNAPTNMSILSTGRKFSQATRSPAPALLALGGRLPAIIIVDNVPPSVPASLVATAVSTTQINLTWSASTDTGGSGLQGYRIYRNGSNTPLTSVGTNSYSDTGLTPSTSYSYTVSAYDVQGNESAKSSSSSATTQGVSSGIFPLSIDSSGRFLRDANGDPFLIHADTPWSLAVQYNRTQIGTYLNDRQAKGFNAIIFNLIEHYFTDNSPRYRNEENNDPFTPMTNFGARVEAYWGLDDFTISSALAKGMLCIVNPAYLGFGGGQEGWMAEITAESAADLQNYGAWLATRYAAYPNIMWCLGGDYAGDATERAKQWNIASGIRSVNPNALLTAHGARTQSARATWGQTYVSQGLNIDNIYTDGVEYTYAAAAYAQSPPMPFFLFEGYYDDARTGSPPATAADCVRQAIAAILSGACGHAFGNSPVWDGGSAVGSGGGVSAALANLSTPATLQMGYVRALFDAYAWEKREPKTDTSVVTTSLGSGTSRIIPARANDGSYVMVWTAGANFTVNLTALAVGTVRARWYNPSDGTYSTVSGSPFTNSGTRSFTAPGSRVLVLDAQPSTATFFNGSTLISGTLGDGQIVEFGNPSGLFLDKPYGEKALYIWEPTKGNLLLSAESRNGTAWPTAEGASAPRYGSIVTTGDLPPNATAVYQVLYSGASNNGFWGPLPIPTDGCNIQYRRDWRINFNGQEAFARRPDTGQGDGWNLKNDRVWTRNYSNDIVGGYADNFVNGNPRYIAESTMDTAADSPSTAGYGLAVNVWLPEITMIRQSSSVGATDGLLQVFQFGRRRVNYQCSTRRGTYTQFYGIVFGPQRERLSPLSTWWQRCGDYLLDDSWCAIEVTDQAPPGSITSEHARVFCVPIEWSADGKRIKCRIRQGMLETLAGMYIRAVTKTGAFVYICQLPADLT